MADIITNDVRVMCHADESTIPASVSTPTIHYIKGDGGGGAPATYDLVIRTQAEFEAMIASPTWSDATSVAFVGQFTLSTANNSGVKRPANVTRIDGYNNAKITVTNYVYNPTTAKGGLWDAETVTSPHCYINDLTVDCTSTGGISYGFNGNNNTYNNCIGTGQGSDGYGFSGSSNTYTNCTGTGIGYGYGFYGYNNIYTNCKGIGSDGYGYGFNGNNNTYNNCIGTGTGDGYGYGFSGSSNTYTNCTGTGIGTGGNRSNGFGFYGNNNTYTSCTGTGTGSDSSNGFGFNGNNNTYTNCTGTGTGEGSAGGYGFHGDNNTCTNCTSTGIGTGIGTGSGYGYGGNNNRIISCTALAYIPASITPSNTNCVPIYNNSTSTNLFMIIRDCKFPQIAKSGYQQGTIWCNIANNTTMVGSIKDNVYHSRFTVAPIKGTNVVADNNSAVDITAI